MKHAFDISAKITLDATNGFNNVIIKLLESQ